MSVDEIINTVLSRINQVKTYTFTYVSNPYTNSDSTFVVVKQKNNIYELKFSVLIRTDIPSWQEVLIGKISDYDGLYTFDNGYGHVAASVGMDPVLSTVS